MALAPWGALGGGQFKTAEQRKTIKGRRLDEPSEQILKVCAALEKLAEKKETTMTSVALAYVMQKTPYVFPIVGGRTPEQLKGNIEALSLVLTKEEIDELEGAAPFDLGFPGTMIGISAGSSWLNDIAGYHDWVESPKVCFVLHFRLRLGFADTHLQADHSTQDLRGKNGARRWCSMI